MCSYLHSNGAGGSALARQWLRFLTSNAGAEGSISGWETKIPDASWHNQKRDKEMVLERITLNRNTGYFWVWEKD